MLEIAFDFLMPKKWNRIGDIQDRKCRYSCNAFVLGQHLIRGILKYKLTFFSIFQLMESIKVDKKISHKL